MRAKYYGARYIITRPILHWAIHTDPAPTFVIKKYGFTPISASSPDRITASDRAVSMAFAVSDTSSESLELPATSAIGAIAVVAAPGKP